MPISYGKSNVKGGWRMLEQMYVMDQLNDFLERRGLMGKFVAAQVGISEPQFYAFKAGHRLLTKSQLKRLIDYMDDYDRRLGGME